jgi:transcriptional regulator with XRE-family HTH domain
VVQRPSVQRQRIGPAIRRMRRTQDLTLDELASQAGISASHLSRLERGQTLPSFQVLSELANVLGADVDDFVRLESEVALIDSELREILTARGVTEDIQQELIATSIELRKALLDAFKAPAPTKRSRSGRGRGGRGDAQQDNAAPAAMAQS